jgi:hypothetical protein
LTPGALVPLGVCKCGFELGYKLVLGIQYVVEHWVSAVKPISQVACPFLDKGSLDKCEG